MKKKLGVILIFLLLFTGLFLVGCGAQKGETEQDNGINITEEEVGQSVLENTGEEGIETEPTTSDEPATAQKTDIQKSDTQNPDTKNPEAKKENNKGFSCTFSITCKTVLDNLDSLDPAKQEIVPKDGVIYAPKKVEFNNGENTFDLLLREAQKNKIHMEYTKVPAYKSSYIEGINNLYEFDCGPLSGWTYRVNGEVLGYGSSNYTLEDGDVIEWVYTCDQGRDIEN